MDQFFLYGRVIEYLQGAALKGRSKTPQQLQDKFQKLFKGVQEEMIRQVNQDYPKHDTDYKMPNIPRMTGLLHDEFDILDEIILDAVMDAVTVPEVTPKKLLEDSVFEATKGTLDRMTDEVTTILSEGYEQGLGPDAITALLEDKFEDMTQAELKRITVTEINGAQSKNNYDQYRAAGIEYHKWLTTQLDNVRATHRPLHGKIVRIGDKFSNGLLHPHDKSGPIGEWINCHCTAVPFLMPFGYVAPPGQTEFTEGELLKVA
ncbi:MAG: hypothetical protein GY841_20075 [FCB group bacterium]|nr:hypothetical protein [FCB group bacterium]